MEWHQDAKRVDERSRGALGKATAASGKHREASRSNAAASWTSDDDDQLEAVRSTRRGRDNAQDSTGSVNRGACTSNDECRDEGFRSSGGVAAAASNSSLFFNFQDSVGGQTMVRATDFFVLYEHVPSLLGEPPG